MRPAAIVAASAALRHPLTTRKPGVDPVTMNPADGSSVRTCLAIVFAARRDRAAPACTRYVTLAAAGAAPDFVAVAVLGDALVGVVDVGVVTGAVRDVVVVVDATVLAVLLVAGVDDARTTGRVAVTDLRLVAPASPAATTLPAATTSTTRIRAGRNIMASSARVSAVCHTGGRNARHHIEPIRVPGRTRR